MQEVVLVRMNGVGVPPPPRPRRLSLPPSFLAACRREVCVVLSSLKKQGVSKGVCSAGRQQRSKLLTHAALAARVHQTGRWGGRLPTEQPLKKHHRFSHGEATHTPRRQAVRRAAAGKGGAADEGRRREPAGYGGEEGAVGEGHV